MKKSITMIIVGFALAAFQIASKVVSNYQLEKNYFQLWELADKSSTITAKRQYISQFVTALEYGYSKREFSDYNAKWLQTPNNGFKENLDAIKSLAFRLDEIQGMKPTSFEYNTAIHQITGQEQGEAQKLLRVISGCYTLQNYPIVWGWIGIIFLFVELILIFTGGAILLNNEEIYL